MEGGGFTVTPAMTSLTGASGEDFASVLRSLGYRMERRPKPAEAAAPPVAPAEPVAAVPEAGEGAEPQPGPEGENAPRWRRAASGAAKRMRRDRGAADASRPVSDEARRRR